MSYTHNTDLVSTTTLDHFVVNERLLSVITDAGVLHLGDNLSRHSPIMLKLDLGSLPTQKRIRQSIPRRPAWYKAEQNHRDEFTNAVHEKISSFPIPESLQCSDSHCQEQHHSEERDSLVLDIMSTLI